MQVLLAFHARKPEAAAPRLEKVAAAWTDTYSQCTHRRLTATVKATGPNAIALIDEEAEPFGRPAWSTQEAATICWYGICENLPPDQELTDSSIKKNSGKMADWRGWFLAARMTREKLTVTNAPVESVSAWYVEGPEGIAAGTRIRPLLELVGLESRPNLEAMSTFACYGWVMGTASLFAGARRIPRGTQIAMQDNRLTVSEHTSLATIFAPLAPGAPIAELARQGGEALRERVAAAAEHSRAPMLHLSGGRDSRMVLAAAKGRDITALTVGKPHNDEVWVAEAAAKKLGLPHEVELPNEIADIFPKKLDRVRDYILWHEGLDKLSHLHANVDWFADSSTPCREIMGGMGGEINRGGFYRKYQKGILRYLPGLDNLKIAAAKKNILRRRLHRYGGLPGALANITESFDLADEACRKLDDGVHRWLDLFYFAERTTHWGADARSTRSATNGSWAPLVDRIIIACGASMTVADRAADRWPGMVVHALAPELAGVPYAHTPAAESLRPPSLPKVAEGENSHKPAPWREILENSQRIWPEITNVEQVHNWLASEREARRHESFFWQLASMELFAEVHFG